MQLDKKKAFAFDESYALYGPIRAMVEDQFRDARTRPSLRVHPGDEMFLHSIAACPTPRFGKMAYFRAGLQILDALRQSAEWHDRPLTSLDRVLDFAAGYGRSTRFLAALLPPERVWSAEILPEAVAFQREEYGVHSMLSSTEPGEFRCEERFDLIFVCSLFSHLPERTWGAWLERLHGLLAPSGILAFSVHGDTLVPPSQQLPANGFLFLRSNEADSWDVADYGTSFVTETFVSRMIEQRLPSGDYVRLPKSVCFHQDLYIVKNGGRVGGDRRFLRGPFGQVEEVRLSTSQSHTYEAKGWAVDMDGGPAPRVVMKVGTDEYATVIPTLDRPDLLDALQLPGGEGLIPKGWTASFRLPARVARPTAALTVAAKDPLSGKEFVLDLNPFWGPLAGPVRGGRRLVGLVRSARGVQRRFGWAETMRRTRAHWSRSGSRK